MAYYFYGGHKVCLAAAKAECRNVAPRIIFKHTKYHFAVKWSEIIPFQQFLTRFRLKLKSSAYSRYVEMLPAWIYLQCPKNVSFVTCFVRQHRVEQWRRTKNVRKQKKYLITCVHIIELEMDCSTWFSAMERMTALFPLFLRDIHHLRCSVVTINILAGTSIFWQTVHW